MDIIYDTTTPDGIEQQPYAAYVVISQHFLLTDTFRRVAENTGQKSEELYNKKVHGRPLVDGTWFGCQPGHPKGNLGNCISHGVDHTEYKGK